VVEELPGSTALLRQKSHAGFSKKHFADSFSGPHRLAARFGQRGPVPIIGMPHHDNHAFFSYMVSPFAHDDGPVMVLVVDGGGDFASISHYVGARGVLQELRNNKRLFDSLGTFYSVISATQGGWTMLSSEGRYMGAAAYGDMNRASNRFYPKLRRL
jgi:carbamoyltransferase